MRATQFNIIHLTNLKKYIVETGGFYLGMNGDNGQILASYGEGGATRLNSVGAAKGFIKSYCEGDYKMVVDTMKMVREGD